jgi:hypothetical protein
MTKFFRIFRASDLTVYDMYETANRPKTAFGRMIIRLRHLPQDILFNIRGY